jgi:hypothetical protein
LTTLRRTSSPSGPGWSGRCTNEHPSDCCWCSSRATETASLPW